MAMFCNSSSELDYLQEKKQNTVQQNELKLFSQE